MQDEPLRIVSRSQNLGRIAAHLRRTRNPGQGSAVRATEAKLALRLSIDLVALLVDGPVVAATEQREIRQCGRAALRPVTDMVALAEPDCAAWEAAAAVAMVERPPERRGNRARAGIDLHDPAVPAVPHHHPAGIAAWGAPLE
jgi:hypothetical protein